MRFIPKNLSLNLPFGLGGITVDISEESAKAAWQLYVEYSTRIATERLPKGQGSVREALSSIHALFEITRTILKAGGLDVAREGEHQSVGTVAILLLNNGVRPFLTRWHTSLSTFEADVIRSAIMEGRSVPNHPALASTLIDEGSWADYDAFHASLEELQQELTATVDTFARMAGVVRDDD